MRILDTTSENSLNNICIYLTKEEARDLMSSISNLLNKKIEHHAHINDDSYQHEITISIYDTQNLKYFDERSKKLIIEDR